MKVKTAVRPLTFRLALWYGFLFAGMFLLYGGVKIILGFMDHNYDDFRKPIAMLALGLALLAIVMAYRELKAWGYYGLVVVNCLAVVSAIFGYSHYENIILLILSGIALYSLFAPATKQYLFRGR